MGPATIVVFGVFMAGVAAIKGADSFGESAGKEVGKNAASVAASIVFVAGAAFITYKVLQKRKAL